MRIKKILLILLSALMCAGLFQAKSSKVVAEDTVSNKHKVTLHSDSNYGYFATTDGNLETVTVDTDDQGSLVALNNSQIPTYNENNTEYIFIGFYNYENTLYYDALGQVAIENPVIDKDIELQAKWEKKEVVEEVITEEIEKIEDELTKEQQEVEKPTEEVDTLLTSNEGEYLLLNSKGLYKTSNGKDLTQVDPADYNMSIDASEGSLTFDGINITGTKFGLVIDPSISSLILRIKDGTTNNITISASSDHEGYGIDAKQSCILLDGTGTLNVKVTDANEIEGSKLYGIYVSRLMTNTNDYESTPYYFNGTLNVQAGTENGIASSAAALFLATNTWDDYSVLSSGSICLLSSGFALQLVNSYVIYNFNNVKDTQRAYGGSSRTWHPINTYLSSTYDGSYYYITNYDKNTDEYAISKSLIFADPVGVYFKYDATSKIEEEYVAKGGYLALPEPNRRTVIKKSEEGKFFAGWKDGEGNIKLPNAVVKINDTQTFEAEWIDCNFTLVYNADPDNGNIKRGFYKNTIAAENLLPNPVGLSFDNDGNLTAEEFTFKTTAPVALKIVSSNTEKPVSLFVNYSLILSATNSDTSKDTTIGLQADNGVEIIGDIEDVSISSKHDSTKVSSISSPKSYAIKGKSLNIQSNYSEYGIYLSAGNANDPTECENIGVYVDDFKVVVDNNSYWPGYLDITASKYPVYAKTITLPDSEMKVVPYGASIITERPCDIAETEEVGDYKVFKNTKHLLIREADPEYTYLRFDANTHKFYAVTPDSGQEPTELTAEQAYEKYYAAYDSDNDRLVLGDGDGHDINYFGPIGLEIVNGDVHIHVNGYYGLIVQDYYPKATEIYGIKSDGKITLTSENSDCTLNVRAFYSNKEIVNHLISKYTDKTPLSTGIKAKSLVLPYNSEQGKGFSGYLNVYANSNEYSQLVNSIGIDITGTTAGSLSINGAYVNVAAYTDISKTNLNETYAIRSKSLPSTVNEKIVGNYKYNSESVNYETSVKYDTDKAIYYYQVKNLQQETYDSRLLTFSKKENSDTLVVDASTGKVYTNTIAPAKEITTMPDGFKIERTGGITRITLNNFAYETSADTAIKILNGDVTIELADDSINSIVDKGKAYVNYGIYCENKITLQGKGTLNVTVGDRDYQPTNFKTYGIYTKSLVLGDKDLATGFNGRLNVDACSYYSDYDGGGASGIGIKVTGTTAKSLSIAGGVLNIKGTLASIYTNAYPYVRDFQILGNVNYDKTPEDTAALGMADAGGYTYFVNDSWTQAKNLSISEYSNVVKIKYVKGDADSGEVPEEVVLKKGSSYNLAYNEGTLKKTGYIFKGWKDADGIEHEPNEEITNIQQDITLSPTWTVIDFAIYYHNGEFHKNTPDGETINGSDLGIYKDESNNLTFTNVNLKTIASTAFITDEGTTNISLVGTNKIEATGTDSTAFESKATACIINGGSGSLTLKGNKYGYHDTSEVDSSTLILDSGYITAEVPNTDGAVAIEAKTDVEGKTKKVNLVSNVHLSIKGNKTIEANTIEYNDKFLNIKGSTSYEALKNTFVQAEWSDNKKTFVVGEDQVTKQLATMPTAVTVYAAKGGLYTDANCTQKLDDEGESWSANDYNITLHDGFALDSTAKYTLVVVDERVNFEIDNNATVNISNSSSLDDAVTVISSMNPSYSYMDEYYGVFTAYGEGTLNINSSPNSLHSKGLVASGINAFKCIKIQLSANGQADTNGHSIGAYIELNDFSSSNYLKTSDNASIYAKSTVETNGVPIVANAKNISSSIEQYYNDTPELVNAYQLKDTNGYFYYYADKQGQNKVNNVYLSPSSYDADCKPYTLLIDGGSVYAKFNESDDEIYELSDADLDELGIRKGYNYETQTPFVYLNEINGPFYSSARVAVELKNSPVIGVGYFEIYSKTQQANSVGILIDDTLYYDNDGSCLQVYTNGNSDSVGVQVNNDSSKTNYRNPIQFLDSYSGGEIYIKTTEGTPLKLSNQILPSISLGDISAQGRSVYIKKDTDDPDSYICWTQPEDPQTGQEVKTRNLSISNSQSSSYGFTLLFDVETRKMYAVLNRDYDNLVEIPTADLKYNYNITIGDGVEYDVAFGNTNSRSMISTFRTTAPIAFQIIDSANPTSPREVKIQYNNYEIDAISDDSVTIYYPNGDITINTKYETTSLISLFGESTLIKCKNLTIDGMRLYLYQYTTDTGNNIVELTGDLKVDNQGMLLIGKGNNVVVNNLILGDGTLAYMNVDSGYFEGSGGLKVNNNIYINDNKAQMLVEGSNSEHGAVYLEGAVIYGENVDESLMQIKGRAGGLISLDGQYDDVKLYEKHFVLKDDESKVARTVKLSYNSDYFIFVPGVGVITLNASDSISTAFFKEPLTDDELAEYGMKISEDATELTLTSATKISTRAQFALLVEPTRLSKGTIIIDGTPTIESIFSKNDEPIQDIPIFGAVSIDGVDLTIKGTKNSKLYTTGLVAGLAGEGKLTVIGTTVEGVGTNDGESIGVGATDGIVCQRGGKVIGRGKASGIILQTKNGFSGVARGDVEFDASTATSAVEYGPMGTYGTYFIDKENQVLAKTTILEAINSNNLITIIKPNGGNISTVGNITSAKEGATVELIGKAESGFDLLKWIVKTTSGTSVNVSSNKFVMPDEDVIVTAQFTNSSVKTITINSTTNGNVKTDVTVQVPGQKVNLTASGNKGYGIDTLEVYYLDGEDHVKVPYSRNSDGTFTFVMPDKAIYVSSTFSSNDSGVFDIYITQNEDGTLFVENDKVRGIYGQPSKLLPTPIENYQVLTYDAYTDEQDPVKINVDGTFTINSDFGKKVFITPYFAATSGEKNIDVNPSAGDLKIARHTQLPGKTVTIEIPDEMPVNVLSTLKVVCEDGTTNVPLNRINDRKFTFVMPNSNVTVFAEYDDSVKYNINVNNVEGGTIFVANGELEASPRSPVTLVVDRKPGYDFDDLSVFTEDGDSIEVDYSNYPAITFEMPYSDVTIVPDFYYYGQETDIYPDDRSVTGEGTISFTNKEIYPNSYCTFTLTPKAGSYLSALYIQFYDNTSDSYKTLDYSKSGNEYTVYIPKLDNYDDGYSCLNINYAFSNSKGNEHDIEVIQQNIEGKTSDIRIEDNLVSAPEGKEVGVWVNIAPGNNYSVEIINKDTGEEIPCLVKDDMAYFYMPDADVSVTVTFNQNPGYSIYINNNTEGGAVTCNYFYGVAGDEIKFKATPDTGFVTNSINVVSYTEDGSGVLLPVKYLGNNTYSFIMPHGDAEITAAFIPNASATGLYDVKTISIGPGNMRVVGDSRTLVKAPKNSKVTIEATPFDDKSVVWTLLEDSLVITNDETGDTITPTKEEEGVYSFTMPESSVTIKSEFCDTTSKGSSKIVFKYDTNETTVTCDRKYLSMDDVLTFAVTPKDGFYIKEIKASVCDGQEEMYVYDNGDGTYSIYYYDCNPSEVNDLVIEISCVGEALIDYHHISVDEALTKGGYLLISQGSTTKKWSSIYSAEAGDQIDVYSYKPDSGLYNLSYVVKGADGEIIPLTDDDNIRDTKHFVMPDQDVTITPVYSDPKEVDVYIYKTKYGEVTSDKTSAKANDTITFTVTPDEGYKLGAIRFYVIDKSIESGERDLEYTVEDGEYLVTLPHGIEEYGSKIYVEARFTQANKKQISITQSDGGTVSTRDNNLLAAPSEHVYLSKQITDKNYTFVKYVIRDENHNIIETATDQQGGTYFVMPNSDVTISAIFTKANEKTITIIENIGNGRIICDRSTQYPGEKVVLNVVPDTSYSNISIIVVDENDNVIPVYRDKETGKYEFTMPNSNVTVNGTFAKPYDIKIKSDIGGTIQTINNTYVANYGDTVTFVVTPNDGYGLKGLYYQTKDGATIKISDNKITMPNGEITVYAEYDATPYNITLRSTDVTKGQLVVSPSSSNVSAGTMMTISTNIHDTDYKLRSINIVNSEDEDITDSILNKTTNTFKMPADNITITGEFVKDQSMYTISVDTNYSEGGSIIEEHGYTKAVPGTAMKYSIEENPGYEIQEVRLVYYDETYDGPKSIIINKNILSGLYEFAMPVANNGAWLYVKFNQLSYDVKYHDNSDTNGSILVDGYGSINEMPQSVSSNNEHTLAITPPISQSDNPYIISSLQLVDEDDNPIAYHYNGSNGDTYYYTFTMPSSAVRVLVKYEELVPTQYDLTVNSPDGIIIWTDGNNVRYEAGETVPLNYMLLKGYALDHFAYTTIVDGLQKDIQLAQEATSFEMPEGNTVVTAVVNKKLNSVTAATAEHGSVSVDKQTPENGEDVTITVSPETDYYLKTIQVLVETESEPIKVQVNNTAENEYKFTVPTNGEEMNITVVPTFKAKDKNDILISTDIKNGNVVETAGKTMAVEDEGITIIATPDEGYSLDKLYYTVAGSTDEHDITSGEEFDMPDANITVHATFKANYYKLTPESELEHGEITYEGEEDPENPGYFQYNTLVKATISPDPGYALDSISVTYDTGVDVPVAVKKISANKYSFMMPAGETDVTGSFVAGNRYGIYVGDTINGSAFVVGNKTMASAGEKVYITVTPNAGYELDRIIIKNNETSYPITIQTDEYGKYIVMPESSITISVTFKAISLNINKTIDHGTISVYSGSKVVSKASIKTLLYITVTPDTGYRLRNLVVKGKTSGKRVTLYATGSGDTTSYSFEMPGEDVEILATLDEEKYSFSIAPTNKGTVKATLEDGKTTAPSLIAKGTKVYLEAEATEGYVFRNFTLDSTTSVSVKTEKTTGKKYFIMPEGSVKVNSTWKPTSTYYWAVKDGKLRLSSTAYDTSTYPISGEVTEAFAAEDSQPWKEYADTITEAVIDSDLAVKSMTYMFQGLTKLTKVTGLSKLHNVTSISGMFLGCKSLTEISLNDLDTSKVTSMKRLFKNCTNLKTVNMKNLVTDKVTSMSVLFYGCENLETIIWPTNLNVSKVTSLSYMFYNCKKLTSLDLSKMKPVSVTNTSYMFRNCEKLETIYVDESIWTLPAVTESTNMFYNCKKLVGGNGTAFDANNTGFGYAQIDKGPSSNQAGYLTDIKTRKLIFNYGEGADQASETCRAVTIGKAYGELPTLNKIDKKQFDGWYDAETGGNKVSATTIMKDTGATIYARWSSDTSYDIKADSGITNGTVKFDKNSAKPNDTITITVTPSDGYVLKTDSLVAKDSEGNPITIINNKFTMPESDVTVTAEFIKDTTEHTVSVDSSIKNGTIEADVTKQAFDNDVNLTITPNPGYKLDTSSLKYSYVDKGVTKEVSITGSSFTMPSKDVTIKGKFIVDSEVTFDLAVDETIKNGTISLSKNKANVEDAITVTVDPAEGYQLKDGSLKYSYVDKGVTKEVSITGYSFVMPGYKVKVTGEFEYDPDFKYSIGISTKGNGTVKTSSATAAAGKTVTITIDPERGYKLKDDTLEVINNKTKEAITVTNNQFVMPPSGVSISAEFEVDTSVTQNIGLGTISHGTITPDINSGYVTQKVTLTALPELGYTYDTITVKYTDGKGVKQTIKPVVASVGIYEFNMPAYPVTIDASFKVDTDRKCSINGYSGKLGTVTPSINATYVTDTVTLTVSPKTGYKLDTLKATYNDGSEKSLELKKVDDTTYTFSMPAYDVTVDATFTKKASQSFYATRQTAEEGYKINDLYMTLKDSEQNNTTTIVEMRGIPMDAWTEIVGTPTITQPTKITGDVISLEVLTNPSDAEQPKQIKIKALQSTEYTNEKGEVVHDPAIVTVTLKNVNDDSKPFTVSFKVYVTNNIEIKEGVYTKGSSEIPILATDEEIGEFLDTTSTKEPLTTGCKGDDGKCEVKLQRGEDETTKATLNYGLDYIAKEGSVRINLTLDKLRTLQPGQYYVYIATKAAITKIPFKVVAAPSPSPSDPSKKDESCEKVIGPTWHWNNDKGICEDVGVVGTSSR